MVGNSHLVTCSDQIEKQILNCIFNQIVISRKYLAIPDRE